MMGGPPPKKELGKTVKVLFKEKCILLVSFNFELKKIIIQSPLTQVAVFRLTGKTCSEAVRQVKKTTLKSEILEFWS